MRRAPLVPARIDRREHDLAGRVRRLDAAQIRLRRLRGVLGVVAADVGVPDLDVRVGHRRAARVRVHDLDRQRERRAAAILADVASDEARHRRIRPGRLAGRHGALGVGRRRTARRRRGRRRRRHRAAAAVRRGRAGRAEERRERFASADSMCVHAVLSLSIIAKLQMSRWISVTEDCLRSVGECGRGVAEI